MVHFNDINKQVKHYCVANELICSLLSPPPPSNVNSILCLPNNVLESHQVNFNFSSHKQVSSNDTKFLFYFKSKYKLTLLDKTQTDPWICFHCFTLTLV